MFKHYQAYILEDLKQQFHLETCCTNVFNYITVFDNRTDKSQLFYHAGLIATLQTLI